MTCGPDPVPRAVAPGSSPSFVSRPAGLVLSPFRALRYAVPDATLPEVLSPPYDVLDADGVVALERLSPANVVRLILPREDSSAQDRYACAAATWARWRAAGLLRADPEPALYVYEQTPPDGPPQRGLLGALALPWPGDGVVLPHEATMPGPVADRLALYTAVQADLEPILLLHEGSDGAARQAVAAVDDRPPLVDAVVRGARQRLWALTDPAQLAAVAGDLLPRRAVIADGHHRYATCLRRQATAHRAGRGAGPWDLGLVLLVDGGAWPPDVRPIHRVLPGCDAAALAARAESGARVERLDGAGLPAALLSLRSAGRRGPAFLMADGSGTTLRLLSDLDPVSVAASLPAGRSAAWRGLDVSVLHHHLVHAVWGLTDDEATVAFAHGDQGALAAAARTSGAAVLLNPTPLDSVLQVARGGELMPRKSTAFTPKPLTGLVLRAHDV